MQEDSSGVVAPEATRAPDQGKARARLSSLLARKGWAAMRSPLFTDLLALIALFVFWGVVLGRAHIHSLWMDVEFTGWVAPLANRLADGPRLYEDGTHMPMPPLPF